VFAGIVCQEGGFYASGEKTGKALRNKAFYGMLKKKEELP